MKILKYFFSLLTILILCSAFTMSEKPSKRIYIIGVSASFADSTVYFTDIQSVEGADLKNGLLMNRSQFSSQLKDFLEQEKGLKNRTCFVYFSEKKDKLISTAKKIKSKYSKNKDMFVKDLGENEFKFSKPVAE